MGPFVFLDVETTGMEPSRHAIIEIACIKWADGKILDRFESLVNPHVPLPYEIVLLTGIRNEMVKEAHVFSEIKEKILQFIGDMPLVGHNIAFDAAFLKSHHLELINPQIDTVVLAHILLRKESSYALEVLMKKYGLPMRDSHRAMADVETTVDFFEFVLKKIEEIPLDAWEAVERILEKSQWEGKRVFEHYTKHTENKRKKTKQIINGGAQKPAKHKQTMNTETVSQNFWGPEIIEKFLKGEKILLESCGEIPWEKLKNHSPEVSIVIAYASLRKRNEILKEGEKYGLSMKVLKEPHFYISPKKIMEALNKKNALSAEETPFFLKMALWLKETKIGDREELSLEREEYGLFETIADHEGKDIFWEMALQETKKCDVVLIHQYTLASGLAEKIPAREKQTRGLIILEASKLEDSFTQALKKKYAEANFRPFFGEQATLLFGLLGIFYEHFAPEEFGGMRGNVILNDITRHSLEWRRFLETLNHLPPHSKKDEMLQTLSQHDGMIQWISNIANELAIHSAPLFIAEIFQRSVKAFARLLIQSEALSGDGTFHFIREIFELDSSLQEIQEKMPSTYSFNLIIPDNFPEPRTEGYFKRCLKLFMEIVEKQKGKTLLILSSKKTLEAMYQALLPSVYTERRPLGAVERVNTERRPLGAVERVKDSCQNVKLLAIGLSGGIGKSVALFLENPANSVLMATNQILPRLQEVEDHLETIVFQKIPFDSPDDPLIRARAGQFVDGFRDYTLPRAVMKFREILAEFQKSKMLKTCYLLDSRLLTRDYGRMFL